MNGISAVGKGMFGSKNVCLIIRSSCFAHTLNGFYGGQRTLSRLHSTTAFEKEAKDVTRSPGVGAGTTKASIPSDSGTRIAKRLAAAGAAPSRRAAEQLIEQGRVTVNGKAVATPALDVMPSDRIAVDGTPLPSPAAADAPPAVVLLHKLRGELVTRAGTDPEGRRTVYDRLAAMGVIDPQTLMLKDEAGPGRGRGAGNGNSNGGGALIPIGRLDMNTEGLLLLTSDRTLARYMELPSSAIQRIYRLRVYGFADRVNAAISAWRSGAVIDGVRYKPAQVVVLSEEEVKRRYGERKEAGAHEEGDKVTRYSPSSYSALPDRKGEDAGDGSDDDAPTASASSSSRSGGGSGTKMNTWLEVTLTEGKNRELRNVADAFSLTVTRLIRVAYGPFSLRGLGKGDAKRVSRVPGWLMAKSRAAATASASSSSSGGDEKRNSSSSNDGGPKPLSLQRHRPKLPSGSDDGSDRRPAFRYGGIDRESGYDWRRTTGVSDGDAAAFGFPPSRRRFPSFSSSTSGGASRRRTSWESAAPPQAKERRGDSEVNDDVGLG